MGGGIDPGIDLNRARQLFSRFPGQFGHRIELTANPKSDPIKIALWIEMNVGDLGLQTVSDKEVGQGRAVFLAR